MSSQPDILVVDDVEYNVFLLSEILEEQGYSVITAKNGQEALQQTRQHHPKLILLDIMMPDMSGLEICKILRDDIDTREIPVIFVSALSDKDDETEGFEAGCVDYITKPICEPVVVARVKTHLELIELRQNLEQQVQQRSEALNATLKDLARSNQVKEEFLATLSHELRTPLNAIKGSLNLLTDSTLDDSQRELINTGLHGSDELHGQINNLLTLNEAIAGNLVLQTEDFALRDSLKPLLTQAATNAQLKGLQFESIIDEQLPDHLHGDAPVILQSIQQLISNAIKFTEKGGIRVSIETDNCDNNLRLKVSVRDTGIGIESEQQNNIFENFQQVETSFNRQHSGLGIGLTLCHHFINLLSGRLTFESEHNKGSLFCFSIPIETQKTCPESQPTAIQVEPHKITILIVEDNAINLMIQDKIVRKEGFKTLSAKDGREALQVFNDNHIDAILMDCQMPVIDGFDTTIAIRRIENGKQHVPIIAVTANANSHDREHCLNAGMDDFLTKPLNAGTLIEKLHFWLGQDLNAQSA